MFKEAFFLGKNIEDSLVIILPCFLSIYTIQTLKVNQACCLGPVLTERLTRRPLFRFYTKYKALHARIQANNVTSTYNTPSARPKSDIILTNSTNSHYNRSVVHVSFPFRVVFFQICLGPALSLCTSVSGVTRRKRTRTTATAPPTRPPRGPRLPPLRPCKPHSGGK